MSRGERVVGIDLGERRIGIALSDATGTIAQPHTVIARARDRATDHRAIGNLVADACATRVVVGMPLSLSGEEGPAARATREEVEALAHALPVPVEVWDERLTTVTAARAMTATGVKRKARRAVIDKVAAAVMLQAWLDAGATSA